MPHKTLRGSLNQHQMFSNTFNEKHEMLKKKNQDIDRYVLPKRNSITRQNRTNSAPRTFDFRLITTLKHC